MKLRTSGEPFCQNAVWWGWTHSNQLRLAVASVVLEHSALVVNEVEKWLRVERALEEVSDCICHPHRIRRVFHPVFQITLVNKIRNATESSMSWAGQIWRSHQAGRIDQMSSFQAITSIWVGLYISFLDEDRKTASENLEKRFSTCHRVTISNTLQIRKKKLGLLIAPHRCSSSWVLILRIHADIT